MHDADKKLRSFLINAICSYIKRFQASAAQHLAGLWGIPVWFLGHTDNNNFLLQDVPEMFPQTGLLIPAQINESIDYYKVNRL